MVFYSCVLGELLAARDLFQPLDDEGTRLRTLEPGGIDLFLVWRIVPCLCFFPAFKSKDDETLRRGPIQGCYGLCAGELATSERL